MNAYSTREGGHYSQKEVSGINFWQIWSVFSKWWWLIFAIMALSVFFTNQQVKKIQPVMNVKF